MQSRKTQSVLIILQALFLVSCHGSLTTRRGSSQVQNGKTVDPGQFSYVVRMEAKVLGLKNPYIFLCTATVLTPRAALTAAHCCNYDIVQKKIRRHVKIPFNITTYRIRYGSAPGLPADELSDKFSNIIKYTLPGNQAIFSKPNHYYYDIALLETEPININSYGWISAVDYNTVFGQKIKVLGYGDTKYRIEQENRFATPLQYIDGVVMKCDSSRENLMYPNICALPPCSNKNGSFTTHSGGPIIHHTGIIGVISKRHGINDVGAFVPLSSSSDWLTRVVQELSVE